MEKKVKNMEYQPVAILKTVANMINAVVIRTFAWCVSTGYFLFRPKKVGASLEFYQALFPQNRLFQSLICVWRQFHDFSSLCADRLIQGENFCSNTTKTGDNFVDDVARQGKGGIMLMSHIGSWDLAAKLFRDKGLKMLIFMGEKEFRRLNHAKIQEMKKIGLEILVSKPDSDSMFFGLEALKFLKKGGFVSIMADRTYSDPRSLIGVNFLKNDVKLPRAPYIMSLISGAPMLTLFPFRLGKNEIQLEISEPFYVEEAPRSERDSTIQKAAQKYAISLENAVKRFPYQWHCFEPFITLPQNNTYNEDHHE